MNSRWMLRLGISFRIDTERELTPLIYKGDSRAKTLIYQTLFKMDEKGNVLPGLAEKWERSEDGLHYTISLRPNVKFHNGAACNAAAVKAHFDRWIHQEIHGWVAATYKIADVEALNETQLRVNLKEPYYLIPDLTVINPTSVSFHPPVKEGEKEEPIGTGPYQILDFEPKNRILLGRFEDFVGQKQSLSRFELKFFEKYAPREPSLTRSFANDEVDIVADNWAPELSRPELASIVNSGKGKLLETSGTGTVFLGFNHYVGIFKDIEWRKRVASVINRKKIIDVAEQGYADPADTVFSPQIELWPKKGKTWEAPKQPPINPGTPPETSTRVTLAVLEYDAGLLEVAQQIADQLAPLGLTVLINTFSYSGAAARRGLGTFDLYIQTTWGLPYDPHTTLFANFMLPPDHLKSAKEGPPFYQHPKLTPLIEESLHTVDPEKKRAIYEKIQNFIDEDVGIIPLYRPRRLALVRPEIEGYQFTATGYDMDVSTLRLKE